MGFLEYTGLNNQQKKWERKQFEKHQRHNIHFASAGVHNFVIVLDHLKAGYNIGKIFRSAEALGAREIHLIGTRFFPLQTAKGAFKHVPAFFHQSFESCYEQLAQQGYVFFILEPDANVSLGTVEFPLNSAFIFGHEGFGVMLDRVEYETLQGVSINQYGKVQSLNVSIAASVVMYEYVRQHGVKPNK